jgi:hypothetical protein
MASRLTVAPMRTHRFISKELRRYDPISRTAQPTATTQNPSSYFAQSSR